MPKTRHLPLRTCVACQRKLAKRELVRIVRTLLGSVQVDPSGKLNGRGAYLCAQPGCWEESLRPKRVGRLEHALRSHLSVEEKEGLRSYVVSLVPLAVPTPERAPHP